MEQSIKLTSGYKIPKIGFGTWQIPDGEETKRAVSQALEVGYRLIDTARMYGNEQSVGGALRASGLPREELFITTKLWNDDQGYDSALKAFDASLKRLGLDYVDLYLIHWPATDMRSESWRALCEIKKQGGARSIGVSNYTIRHLEQLLNESEDIPAVNQVEFHPFIYRDQKDLLAFCAKHKILVEAYSPLSHARSIHHHRIMELADKYRKSPAQIMLRWAIQHGTVPIPKSSHPGRIAENIDVFDFELSDHDVQYLDKLSRSSRVTWDPTDLP